jgi:hypothetical protein
MPPEPLDHRHADSGIEEWMAFFGDGENAAIMWVAPGEDGVRSIGDSQTGRDTSAAVWDVGPYDTGDA